MTDTLIVQLIPPISGTDADDESAIDCAAQWMLLPLDATSDTLDPETGTLYGLLQEPPVNCRWIVLVPGEAVLTTTVRLPGKRRRQALKALPFLLEDSIASDVTQEHLAIGAENALGETLVAVIRKQWLRDLLQIFNDAGVEPYMVLPDYAALGENAESFQVLVSGDRAIVRCPDGTGFSTPLSRVTALLNTGRDSGGDVSVRSVQWIRPAGSDAPALPDGWQINEQVVDSPLRLIAAGAANSSLNVLQKEFRVIERTDMNWRPWATAAVLAFLAICISLLETGLETVRFNREAEQLQASISQLARDALPEARQIRDPQAQLLIAWRQLKGGGADAAEFLPLLNRVVATISRQPVNVRSVQYRDGTLTVALQGNSLQQLDTLRQQIEEQGLYATLLNANTDSDSAYSNLVITTVGAREPGSAG